MTILKAICDICGEIIESTDDHGIGVDCNNEILCRKCQKKSEMDIIRKDIEKHKLVIICINKTIDGLEAELNSIRISD